MSHATLQTIAKPVNIVHAKNPLLFLVGPTAIGKTELALAIAEQCNCEIIGVDSMQIYKYMEIGTAKPTPDERKRVRHHLIDYVNPDEHYNAARFVVDTHTAINNIHERGKNVLLAGGTGLYFRALSEGMFEAPVIDEAVRAELKQEQEEKGLAYLYASLEKRDPISAARIHKNDSYRILRALEIYRSTGKAWSQFIDEQKGHNGECGVQNPILKIGLERQREELYDRINRRCGLMIEQGLLDEVKELLGKGFGGELSSMQSLGYRHMVSYLNGDFSWEKSLELLARDTRRYAKRQFTWFRADTEIDWFHPEKKNQILRKVKPFFDTEII